MKKKNHDSFGISLDHLLKERKALDSLLKKDLESSLKNSKNQKEKKSVRKEISQKKEELITSEVHKFLKKKLKKKN